MIEGGYDLREGDKVLEQNLKDIEIDIKIGIVIDYSRVDGHSIKIEHKLMICSIRISQYLIGFNILRLYLS